MQLHSHLKSIHQNQHLKSSNVNPFNPDSLQNSYCNCSCKAARQAFVISMQSGKFQITDPLWFSLVFPLVWNSTAAVKRSSLLRRVDYGWQEASTSSNLSALKRGNERSKHSLYRIPIIHFSSGITGNILTNWKCCGMIGESEDLSYRKNRTSYQGSAILETSVMLTRRRLVQSAVADDLALSEKEKTKTSRQSTTHTLFIIHRWSGILPVQNTISVVK